MKKKILCISVGLALILTACGSSSDTKTELADEETVETETAEIKEVAETDPPETEEETDPGETTEEESDSVEEIEQTVAGTDLLDNAFVYLAGQIGKMTYDECISYVESEDFTYEAVQATEDDMGVITINDESNEGFHLAIDFFPDDYGIQTITLVSYSNGNFEGSATDNVHMTDVEYGTYDFTADPKNVKVKTLDEVITFIKEDVPIKVEQYADSVSDNKEIEVALDVSYEIKNGATVFTINTNLPDETVLMLTLSNGTYIGQTNVTIKNGTATSEGFSNKGSKLRGKYTLGVSMSYAKLQADSVKAVIGSSGEFLTGEYVEESSGGGGNVVSAQFNFNF